MDLDRITGTPILCAAAGEAGHQRSRVSTATRSGRLADAQTPDRRHLPHPAERALVCVAGRDRRVLAPVLTLEEAAHHPHNSARGTFFERDGVLQPSPAPRF